MGMRKFFLLTACLCGLCMGEDDPRCDEMEKIIYYLLDKNHEDKAQGKGEKHFRAFEFLLFGALRDSGCECVEKTACPNAKRDGLYEYRTSYKCQDGETVSIFTDIQGFVAKVGGGLTSGSAGQPERP
jgi:hypothetical protein